MRHPRQASPCGDAASRQSHESITQGSPVASVVSLVEMHYAGGNDLSRLVDFGAATVATPGVCGSGELSGAASEHCRQNRKRRSAADWNGNWSRQEVKRRHVLSGRRTKTLRGYWMAVVCASFVGRLNALSYGLLLVWYIKFRMKRTRRQQTAGISPALECQA